METQNKEAMPTKSPRMLREDEIDLVVQEVRQDGVVVKLWPKPAAVRALLAEAFGRWSTRHYACGRALYCGVGVGSDMVDYVYRDAPAPSRYSVGNDAAQNEADGSFLAAAALWGVGTAIFEMPSLRINGERVVINPVAGRDGKTISHYVLADKLTLDKVQSQDGQVTGVQLVTDRGVKIVWQK